MGSVRPPICDHVWTGTRDQLISALPQIISSHRTAQLISVRIVRPFVVGRGGAELEMCGCGAGAGGAWRIRRKLP
jgi:hypothetical protein